MEFTLNEGYANGTLEHFIEKMNHNKNEHTPFISVHRIGARDEYFNVFRSFNNGTPCVSKVKIDSCTGKRTSDSIYTEEELEPYLKYGDFEQFSENQFNKFGLLQILQSDNLDFSILNKYADSMVEKLMDDKLLDTNPETVYSCFIRKFQSSTKYASIYIYEWESEIGIYFMNPNEVWYRNENRLKEDDSDQLFPFYPELCQRKDILYVACEGLNPYGTEEYDKKLLEKSDQALKNLLKLIEEKGILPPFSYEDIDVPEGFTVYAY